MSCTEGLPGQAGNKAAGLRLGPLRPTATVVLLVLPAAAELVAGGWRLGGPSLWRDEGDTLAVATRPVHGILTLLLHHQDAVHGPYYLLMHFVLAAAGTSPVTLRLPSLLASAGAASMTAVVGRRLGRASGLPAPTVIGVAAGLILVVLPRTTWYAQDGRPYAISTLLAAVASYLLIRGCEDGRARWWAGYGVAIGCLGAMDLLALTLLPAHAVSLAAVRRPAVEPGQEPGAPRRWRGFLLASGAALACLLPLVLLTSSQSRQFSWIGRPGVAAVQALLADFAGRRSLEVVVFGLAALCVTMEALSWRTPGCTLAKIALPWLVLPPVILIGVSRASTPVYSERYVMFCTPAIALLAAGGLAWLGRMLASSPRPYRWLTVVTPAATAALIVAMLIGPQLRIRLTSARPDNLARVASLVASWSRPGDGVLYVPRGAEVASQAYPAAFAGLRDIAQRKSAGASGTLRGLSVSAALLTHRFRSVSRLWTVAMGRGRYPDSALGRAEHRLVSALRLARTWTIRSITLSLYVRR